MTRGPTNAWTLAVTAKLGGFAMNVRTEGDTG
jgi:hypothetical protein